MAHQAHTFVSKIQHINTVTDIKTTCYHCGDICEEVIIENDKPFCCNGCKQVYLLLEENNLCSYYNLDSSPGIKARGKFTDGRFAYLDDPTMVEKLSQFQNNKLVNITFSLPQMHCASCVFLLENLHKINEGILTSRVNFQRKEIFISFDPARISLRKTVELLSFIGYEPEIKLNDTKEEKTAAVKKMSPYRRRQLYRIGIAGFCFSNIMMFSFPEYFSGGQIGDGLKNVFPLVNFFLSLPVLLYSAAPFFISAFKGFRQKEINIDAPIALATTVTFARSYFEILSDHGAGWLDSGSGIVFFMLIGRWFQDKTYDSLSFDRDYLSYFPLGVTVLTENSSNGIVLRQEKNIPVTKLKTGDRIILRNEEMIPADAILLRGKANVDYSFVNGENTPESHETGDLLYAGGKHIGEAIELEVVKEVSQSYISELWNSDVFAGTKNTEKSFIHPWSRYFTAALFTVAAFAVIYWSVVNPSNVLPALTSVLIVACPCSLLLSATFTNGNMLRLFGRNKLYMKNASVIEALGKVDTIVFDKTGTITEPHHSLINFVGKPLTDENKQVIRSVAMQSAHPLSRMISNHLVQINMPAFPVTDFREVAGKGVVAAVNNHTVRIGSSDFIAQYTDHNGSHVHVEIDGIYRGHFSISNYYRNDIHPAIASLRKHHYHLHVLSGDNDTEKDNLRQIFGETATLKFRQLPLEKLDYVKALQQKGAKVLMIGDGLNDAGALRQADVGISVNDNNAQFTPACDAILDGAHVKNIHRYMRYARAGKQIITACFILSILYNFVGLSFAVSAHLSPMVAAILMPASSISIVLFATGISSLVAKRLGL